MQTLRFVRDIHESAYNYRLLSNILRLADSSQICVCCEGVETEEELQVLGGLGSCLVQGVLFSKPVEEERFTEQFFGK